MIIIASLWEKFQTNPTITGLDTDFHNWDVEFPAISFCQERPVDNALAELRIKLVPTLIKGQHSIYRQFNLGTTIELDRQGLLGMDNFLVAR